MSQPSSHLQRLVGSLLAALSLTAGAAERFGDVSVVPQSVSGNTYHGYREFRVLLENHSTRQAHQVTLVLPDRSFPWGNSISRISRTVSLAPSARMVVPLWQPPLPQSGNGLLRVVVDREDPVTVGYTPFSHVNRSGRYGNITPVTVLVSRSLNYDDLKRVFKAGHSGMSADRAVGVADSPRGYGGTGPTAWSPDPSAAGPHWIELEYDPPIQADRLRVHETSRRPGSTEVSLVGVSGTNLTRIILSTATGPLHSAGFVESLFSRTPEPVKRVRLDYGNAHPSSIMVDAVELHDSARSISAWAVSARASSENSSWTGGPYGAPGPETHEWLRSETPVSEWSEYWLSYTPYDAIALNAADWRTMPPSVANAVRQYTECGGTLLLFGGGELPTTWRSVASSPVDGVRSFEASLGQCFSMDSGEVSGVPPEIGKQLMLVLTDASRRRGPLPDPNSANGIFPVVANVQVPVRGMVLVMLGFVLIIGPVNLFVLSRLKRRIWLLWTIPAVSVLTTGGMFAYSFFREGFTPDVRIEGFTCLDQVHRRAATMGTAGFYCPLTPSQGLFFSPETEAAPLVDAWDYRSGVQREIDWTRGQHLQRGWVSARLPAHFLLRKAESRRERLQVERSGNRLSVVNGLGAGIKFLRLCDDAGRIYAASGVPAGQKAVLTPVAGTPNHVEPPGARTFAQKLGCGPFDEKVLGDAQSYLSPGTYVVELDANPFLENALGSGASLARNKVRAVVYGILEPLSPP